MPIKVTVEDTDTGEKQTATVPENDYFLLCVGSCYVSYTNAYANGTHVVTIKGRKKGL